MAMPCAAPNHDISRNTSGRWEECGSTDANQIEMRTYGRTQSDRSGTPSPHGYGGNRVAPRGRFVKPKPTAPTARTCKSAKRTHGAGHFAQRIADKNSRIQEFF